jgi:hypothetical protein
VFEQDGEERILAATRPVHPLGKCSVTDPTKCPDVNPPIRECSGHRDQTVADDLSGSDKQVFQARILKLAVRIRMRW